jgi:hypothetical protein
MHYLLILEMFKIYTFVNSIVNFKHLFVERKGYLSK